MTRLLMAVLLILSFQNCSDDDTLSETEKKAISHDVIKTLHRYYSDINQSGLTAEFKYLDNSKEFFWVPPGYSGAIRYDSVKNILTRTAPAYKSIRNTFKSLQVFPLTENYATYTASIESTMTDTTGRSSTYSLLETGVMIKRSDGWKLLNGQTSILNH